MNLEQLKSRFFPAFPRPSRKVAGFAVCGLVVFGIGGVVSVTNKGFLPFSALTAESIALGDTFIGYSTLRAPDFQDALASVGIDLTYADEFDQKTRAQRLGEADFVVTSLDQVIRHEPDGKIVAMWDHTKGADAVVLNTKKYPLLKGIDALSKEVKIAAESGKQYSIVYAADTPSEYLVLLLANKFPNFRLEEFRLMPVEDASEAYKLLKDPNEDIALAVLWEPFVSQASKNGYTVVLSSADVPETVVDVLLASNRVIENNPQKVRNFLETYYARVDGSRLDGTAFKNQFIQESGLSEIESLKLLRGIHFFDSIESSKWLNEGILLNKIKYTSSVLLASGRLTRFIKQPETLFDGRFLSLAVANSNELREQLDPKQEQQETEVVPPPVKNPTVTLGKVSKDIQFDDPGSIVLSPDSKEELDNLLKNASDFGGATAIQVSGHTSASGSAERNRVLSSGRVLSVIKYLKGKGFKGRIVERAIGSSSPLVDIPSDDPRQQRVEVEIVRETP